jgi:hypothetical protein
MKLLTILIPLLAIACSTQQKPLVADEDMSYLEDLTKVVIDSSRIGPGQDLPPAIRSFGPNRSGITLIKPGGRDCYPSFWVRDYAMSLESGFITPGEQQDILLYTAARQSDSTWVTVTGSRVPRGSIPDHIRINDGLPVFFPGTYDPIRQGNEVWRTPPYGDQFFFIHMAWYYIRHGGDRSDLERNINGISLFRRMAMAFEAVPAHPGNGLVFISDSVPTCDFGFRDVVRMTGEVCFGSVLRYRAALEMAEMYELRGSAWQADTCRMIAGKIRSSIPVVFANGSGLLGASTGLSSQPDVWATAFAVYTGALEGIEARRAAEALDAAYKAGYLSMEGQIRHVPANADYDSTTAWELALAAKNHYQNGAYWGTATGWVFDALARVDRPAAAQLLRDFVTSLRNSDFRKGMPDEGAPYECVYPPTNYKQNPVYMTTVTVPWGVLREWKARRWAPGSVPDPH